MDNEEREELRRFLAEEVMGWKLVYIGPEWNRRKGKKHWCPVLEDGNVFVTGKYPEEDWQPDIRIEQAMELLKKGLDDYKFTGAYFFFPDDKGEPNWAVRIEYLEWNLGKLSRKDGWGYDEELAEAICRAVKEAWSQKEEK